MKTRVIQNLDFSTNEICWGVSIQINGGRLYCKYPIGYQSFDSKHLAEEGRKKIENAIKKGATVRYMGNVSRGLNKHERVQVLVTEV